MAEGGGCVRSGEGAVVMMADDVLPQDKSQEALKVLLHISTEWQRNREATWYIEKCSYIQEEQGEGEEKLNDQKKGRNVRNLPGNDTYCMRYNGDQSDRKGKNGREEIE